MPGATTRFALPYPVPGDAFRPASVDFPALANAIDAVMARNPASVLAAQQILDVGRVGQIRAGRTLLAADFTTLLGGAAPVGLYALSDVSDSSGNARTLTNKGAVPFGVGINGAAATAAVFAGSTGQALFIADTGAADAFRIRTGSWGCWFRTAKRGLLQTLFSKWGATTAVSSWALDVSAANVAQVRVTDGTTVLTVTGVTDVADDRWHFVEATFDGTVGRLYVDGTLEASSTALAAPMNSGASAPVNVGGQTADGATAATNPAFGRVDNAFVTTDVHDEAQGRLLMAAKIAHGQTFTPTRSHPAIRRRRRGAALVTGDFSATPKHLYNLADLTDLGSLNNALTNNAGAVQGASPAGGNGAYIFAAASSQYLSVTDAGLPATTTARTLGCWFKTVAAAQGYLIVYGTNTAGNRYGINIGATGLLSMDDGALGTSSPLPYNDGQWHHVVVVADGAAADGLKQKMYVDGRLAVATTTAIGSTTLAGANALRIGAYLNATLFFSGSISRAFITDYAMAPDEIGALFAKGFAIGPTTLAVPDDADTDAGQIVQGFDATNAYVLADVRRRIGGRVNSNGTIAAAVGGDFRVIRTGVGSYTVFPPPGFFGSIPEITVSNDDRAQAALYGFQRVRAAAIESFVVTTMNAANAAEDQPFQFIADGRGPLGSQNVLDLAVAA